MDNKFKTKKEELLDTLAEVYKTIPERYFFGDGDDRDLEFMKLRDAIKILCDIVFLKDDHLFKDLIDDGTEVSFYEGEKPTKTAFLLKHFQDE